MDVYTDEALYLRGAATLVASWSEDARGSDGAGLQRLPGVAAAVFPHGPERNYYNNALLERGLSIRRRAEAIAAMENAYAATSVSRFAAWAHETDRPMHRDLERRGYRIDTTTRAMSAASQTNVYRSTCLKAGPKRKSWYVRTKLSNPIQPPPAFVKARSSA